MDTVTFAKKRVILIVRSMDTATFAKKGVTFLNDNDQKTLILINKAYAKPALQYHFGDTFGKKAHKPYLLANTMLCYMLSSLFLV